MSQDGSEPTGYDDVPLSALLKSAGSVYTDAVRRAQSRVGCDDLPAAGSYLISAMHWSGATLEAVIRWMGVSKQAVSQAVDTLVLRGYLVRVPDAADRRRVNLVLTERGRSAGRAAQAAIERVDRGLEERLGAEKLGHAREALVALLRMRSEGQGLPGRGSAGAYGGHPSRRKASRLRHRRRSPGPTLEVRPRESSVARGVRRRGTAAARPMAAPGARRGRPTGEVRSTRPRA